jgi:hypothetical protein
MNTYFRSMVSLGAVVVFAWLALGSGSVTTVNKNETYDEARGVYVTQYLDRQNQVLSTKEGQQDYRGRWEGEIKETYVDEDGYYLTEYDDGVRHGWRRQYDAGGRLIGSQYYQNDILMDPSPSPLIREALIDMAHWAMAIDPGAFYQQLGAQRPWFIDGVEGLGSTTDQLKGFIDEIEAYVLSKSPPNQSQFDTHFDSGVNTAKELEAYQAVYDDYKDLHSVEILEAGKNDTLRLATLDRYEGGLADSTFDIIQTTYPHYIETLKSNGATLEDMQRVTAELDRRLDALGPLDPNDPEFLIEADARLDATLSAMRSDEFDFGTTTSAIYTEFVKMSRAEDPIYQAAKGAYFGVRDRSGSDWRITEIYIATLGYAPDSEGLNYWVAEIAAKPDTWNPTTVAQSFFDQPLVEALYPKGQDPGVFVDALYQNLFGRAPDAAGRAYWLEELRSGRVQRNQMIIALIEGGWANPDAATDMARFGNQIEVGLAFAAAQTERGLLYSRLSTADQAELRRIGRELIAGVTDDAATRTAAIASLPGLFEAF